MPSANATGRRATRPSARRHDLPRFFESGTYKFSKAALLVCFLRFVEDNAASLGLSFEETEKLDAIGQAYGTAFFPVAQLTSHVANIAGRLGMDKKAFADFIESFAPNDFRQAFAGFTCEAGDFSLDKNESISRDLCAYADYAASRMSLRPYVLIPHPECELAPLILRQVLANEQTPAEAQEGGAADAGASSTLSIFNPYCCDGELLCLSFQHLAGRDLELSACDPSGINVAVTSMRLLLLGYRGDYGLIRKGEDIALRVGTPDVVMVEFHPNGSTDFSDFRNSMRLVSRGRYGFLFGELDIDHGGDEDALVRKTIAQDARCAAYVIPALGTRSLTVLLPGEASAAGDMFLVRATAEQWEKGDSDAASNEFASRLASIITRQEDVLGLSGHVARKEILARADCSLDITDYMGTNGLGAPLVAPARLDELAQRYKQAASTLQEADDAFASALEQLSKNEEES